MKIFISWSGDLSKSVAAAFHSWLKLVLTGCEPFMSDEDIDKGTRGLSEIAEQLEKANVGLLCMSKQNIDRPWINFEAGAISKKVGKGLVMPFLIDLSKSEVPQYSPLTQFQMTVNSEEDIRKMVHSINRSGGSEYLSHETVDEYLDAFWGRLSDAIARAMSINEEKANEQPEGLTPLQTGPSVGAMMAEVLDLVRSQQREVSDVSNEMQLVRRLLHQRFPADPYKWDRPRHEVIATVMELSRSLHRMPTVEELADGLGISLPEFMEMEAEAVEDGKSLLRAVSDYTGLAFGTPGRPLLPSEDDRIEPPGAAGSAKRRSRAKAAASSPSQGN